MLFADAISRLRTSAAIVAISAIPSFTTSFVSVLRCSSGKRERKSRAASAPPKTHAKVMPPTTREFRIYLLLVVICSFDLSFTSQFNFNSSHTMFFAYLRRI